MRCRPFVTSAGKVASRIARRSSGTLGLLASYEWVRRHALGLGPLRRWAPLMAGAALLGYLGMGGDPASPQAQRTDVVAHVTGFLAGVLIGFVTGHLRLPDRLGRPFEELDVVGARPEEEPRQAKFRIAFPRHPEDIPVGPAAHRMNRATDVNDLCDHPLPRAHHFR